jgi:hypothetical protein
VLFKGTISVSGQGQSPPRLQPTGSLVARISVSAKRGSSERFPLSFTTAEPENCDFDLARSLGSDHSAERLGSIFRVGRKLLCDPPLYAYHLICSHCQLWYSLGFDHIANRARKVLPTI